MVGPRQNVLIFFVITVGIANVFAYPTVVFENQDNGNYKNHEIPTKRSNGLNDLADLQSQIAAFQLSQVWII